QSGELGAIDTARHRCGRPRYVILPHHLAAWERGRQAAPPPRPARRRERAPAVDYYPDCGRPAQRPGPSPPPRRTVWPHAPAPTPLFPRTEPPGRPPPDSVPPGALAGQGLSPADVRRHCPCAVEYTDLGGGPCWRREDLAPLLAEMGGAA